MIIHLMLFMPFEWSGLCSIMWISFISYQHGWITDQLPDMWVLARSLRIYTCSIMSYIFIDLIITYDPYSLFIIANVFGCLLWSKILQLHIFCLGTSCMAPTMLKFNWSHYQLWNDPLSPTSTSCRHFCWFICLAWLICYVCDEFR